MKEKIRLRILPDGAELVTQETNERSSDLVRTSAKQKVSKTAEAAIYGMEEIADFILDVFEEFTEKASQRKLKDNGKLTVSFGVTGGMNANLKLVGAKADAFITATLEFN